MMDATTQRNLQALAAYWRGKKTAIESRFSGSPPGQTAAVCAAFESCAEDVENLLQPITPLPKPTP